MPKPVTLDIADRGEIFTQMGATIRQSIALKVNDRLMQDMTNSMNEIEKLIGGYEDTSTLVGLIVGLASPETLSAQGRVVHELALAANAAKNEAAELLAVANNLDAECVYVLNFEQIKRYGLDVFGKA